MYSFIIFKYNFCKFGNFIACNKAGVKAL